MMINVADESRDRQYEIALNWGRGLPMNQHDTFDIDEVVKRGIQNAAADIFTALAPAPDCGYVGRIIFESGEFGGVSPGAIMMQVWTISDRLFGERI